MKGVGYFDGSCISRSGAYGYVIYYKKKNKVETIPGGSHISGFATSNEAEYSGLIGLLGSMLIEGFTDVHIRGDSQLVINQMKGEYKVRKDTLIPLYKQALTLSKQFKSIEFEHVKRDLNKAADVLSKAYNPILHNKGDTRTTEKKIKDSIKRIKVYEPKGGYLLGFSGGKDSLAIYHLSRLAGVKFDPVYNITGVDPPDLISFIKEKYPNVRRVKPRKTMWELIPEKLIPPTRHLRYCCYYLKETSNVKGKVVMTGVRQEESRMRSHRRVCDYNTKTKTTTFNPIVDWTEADVWSFLEKEAVEYCNLYDEGFTRLGCVGCPMASEENIRKEFRLYPTIEKKYLKAFDEMLTRRKAKGLETTWKNSGEVMEWWIKT